MLPRSTRPLLVIVLIFSSFAVNAAPSAGPVVEIPKDIAAAAQSFYEVAGSPELTPETCAPAIQKYFDVIYKLPPQHFTGLEKTNEAIEKFFLARLKLRDRLREFTLKKQFANSKQMETCVDHIRVAIRTLRGLEDYWGVRHLRKQGLLERDMPKFNIEAPYSLVNPVYAKEWKFPDSLVSGDILMSRGSSFTSAVISRVGTVDNQFSHLAILYIDDGSLMGPENKGQKYVVEAELNGGLLLTPWDKYIADAKARIVVFRTKNLLGSNGYTSAQVIAAKAAQVLAFKAKNEKVCYNFGMDMNDTKCLFCSQAVSFGLDAACTSSGYKCEVLPYQRANAPVMPIYYTSFASSKNPLLQMLDIRVSETFSPADAEIEPRLDFVAEWRNYSLIPDARIYDMVLTKMFQWMEQGGYQLKQDSEIIFYVSAFAEKLVKEIGKMPDNTPPGFVKGTILLYFLMQREGAGTQNIAGQIVSQKIRETIENTDIATLKEFAQKYQVQISEEQIKKLTKRSAEVANRVANHLGFAPRMTNANTVNLERTGYDLSDYQLDRAMEGYRLRDCDEYHKTNNTRFHDLFSLKIGSSPQEACNLKPFSWNELF